jgi:hypothetical protein
MIWQGSGDTRSLTTDGRRFLADHEKSGWTLSELTTSGLVTVAEDISWSEIDLALQQFIGGN